MSDYLAKSQRTYTKRPDSATRCEEPAMHLPEQFVDEARKIMQEKNLRITTVKSASYSAWPRISVIIKILKIIKNLRARKAPLQQISFRRISFARIFFIKFS